MDRRSFIKFLVGSALLPMVEKRSALVKKLPAKVLEPREIKLRFSSVDIIASPRKLKSVWKIEQAADLERWHGSGLEDEIIASIKREYQS